MSAAPDAVAATPKTGGARSSRGATLGWAALFGFLCLLMVIVGLETALHFLGPAIDGPFQLYNSLRRIWVGQRGGVDFQFFHGMGIPFLHYLPFRLLGGGFIASEMSRELVSALLYPITALVFLRFFIRDWTRTLAWAAIVMAGSIALRMTSLLVAVNSLLGIRSTLPTLLPIVLCLPLRRAVRNTLAGIVLGVALVMGTEQGLAAMLALMITTAVVAWRSRERAAYLIDCVVIIVIGVVTLVATLMLIGGVQGMRGALAYNFRLVPLDQYWYFGAPPNLFLSSWGDVPKLLMTIPRIPVTLLVGVAVVGLTTRSLWRDVDGPGQREQFAFTMLAMYGLISCTSLLGTYVHAYVQPLLRILLLLGAVLLDRRLPARDTGLQRRLLLGVSRTVAMTAVATLLIMIAVVPSVFVTVFVTIPHVVRDHVIGRKGAVYSGIWPETLIGGQALFNSRRGPDGAPPTLWSTYAGLLEARNGLFHPSFDYIIHALGPANRAAYVSDFRRLQPRLVQTVSPEYTQYEAWIEDTSWDFYVELLRHYELIGGTPWSFMWERREAGFDRPTQVWSSPVPAGADSLELPLVPVIANTSSIVLLQVEIDYRARNALHSLPIIGGLPRYLVRAANVVQKEPVTVDPYTTTTRFPLIAKRGFAPVLHWRAYSLLPGASLEITAVRLSVVRTSARNEAWLTSLVAQQLGKLDQ
ncbi:MAG: hypothetical protein ABJF01_23850 [bacterium]